MTTTPLDEVIEEAAMIWLRERDQQPCSLRRQRLLLMIHEITRDGSQASPPAKPNCHRGPFRDIRMAQANDTTFDTDPN